MASVRVAVRVRPLNERERQMDSDVIIEMKGKSTSITNNKIPKHVHEKGEMGRERVKTFSYDHSYWSANKSDPHYTPQDQVFKDLGSDVISSAYEGYNACCFAYGQTGSGKSHTMMGQSHDQGLIPRICEGLFAKMKMTDSITYRTEISYLEIYNERVRDLLRTNKSADSETHTLRVREHPKDGPYVQDLSIHLVNSYEDIADLMNRGNMNRTTACTNMNDTSSRSHAIFTIVFTQAKFHKNMPSETRSKIHLVDLAGSERADATGATGVRLKEGASINKSLVTLGNVISILADLADTSRTRRQVFIPYRDSVLTWLLKDSLGGNAKTIMIATISPACVNYAETLSTLRYANRAKNIVNKPTVNEDPNVRLIRELRAEISRLRMLTGGNIDKLSTPRVQEKLCENEARVKILTDEWTGRWKEAHSILEEERMALRKEGLGVVLDSEMPHLIGIDDDILSTGIMLYHLKIGKTTVGTEHADVKQDIELSGIEVEEEHCEFVHDDGLVWLYPREQSLCMVNGVLINEPIRLNQGSVILLGRTNMFRFNHPAEAAQLRKDRALGRQNRLASDSGLEEINGNHMTSFGSASPRRRSTGSNLNLSRWSLMSQSMSDLGRSTESLNGVGILEMEERHMKQLEELERKRVEIMDMERRHADSERSRLREQETREQELEEKRLILERMNAEADLMKEEAVQIQQMIHTEEVQLRKKSRDIEKRLQDHLIEKEQFEVAKEQEMTKIKMEKEREFEEIKTERRNLEKEKAQVKEEIQEDLKKLMEQEEQHIKAVQEAKDELSKEVEKMDIERRLEKDKLTNDWRHLEEKEKQFETKAKTAEAEIMDRRLQLLKQRDEEVELLEQDRLDLVRLKAGAEQTETISNQNETEEIIHLRENLNNRETQISCHVASEKWRIIQRYEDQLRTLESEKDEVKKEWDAINERGAILQNRLENGDCNANVEKEELELLEKEVLLLQEKEDILTSRERDCKLEQTNELKNVENCQANELETINAEKQKLLVREKLNLHQVERDIVEKSRHLDEKKKRLSLDEKTLLELEESQTVAMREAEEKRAQLEAERNELAELACRQEAEAEVAMAELDRRKSTLDDLAKQEMEKITEQMRRLSSWDGLNGVAEHASTGSVDTSSECSDLNDVTRDEELEKLEKRMEALKIIEDQFRRSENELEEKRTKFADERQQELDKIDMEKCKLEELENQKRINMLVEEAVKKRLYEERAQRDKKFQEERDKDRLERQTEMEKMRQEHHLEIETLKRRYELPDLTPNVSPIHTSKANPFASTMNCDARPDRDFVRRKYQARSRSLSSLAGITQYRLPRIAIPTYLVRGYGIDTHYEYEIKISTGDEQWSVCRRYSRFRKLHQYMKGEYPDVCALAFPPKRFLGSRSSKVVQERKILLEAYLQHLFDICSRDPESPLNITQNTVITKRVVHDFSAFFKMGVFETGKHGSA